MSSILTKRSPASQRRSKNLPEFVLEDIDGSLMTQEIYPAKPSLLFDDEKFWEEVDKETRSGIKTEYQFCYVNSHTSEPGIRASTTFG